MSVTFAPEANSAVDTRIFTVACDATGQVIGEYAGYSLAYGEAQAHGLVCTEDLCAGYGGEVEQVFADGDPRWVNATNRNAMDILAALGFALDLADPELYGAEDATAFLGRVELALGMGVDDAALPTITWRGGSNLLQGNMVQVDCGRRDGYLTEKLFALRELAVACRAQGVRVVWS